MRFYLIKHFVTDKLSPKSPNSDDTFGRGEGFSKGIFDKLGRLMGVCLVHSNIHKKYVGYILQYLLTGACIW